MIPSPRMRKLAKRLSPNDSDVTAQATYHPPRRTRAKVTATATTTVTVTILGAHVSASIYKGTAYTVGEIVELEMVGSRLIVIGVLA